MGTKTETPKAGAARCAHCGQTLPTPEVSVPKALRIRATELMVNDCHTGQYLAWVVDEGEGGRIGESAATASPRSLVDAVKAYKDRGPSGDAEALAHSATYHAMELAAVTLSVDTGARREHSGWFWDSKPPLRRLVAMANDLIARAYEGASEVPVGTPPAENPTPGARRSALSLTEADLSSDLSFPGALVWRGRNTKKNSDNRVVRWMGTRTPEEALYHAVVQYSRDGAKPSHLRTVKHFAMAAAVGAYGRALGGKVIDGVWRWPTLHIQDVRDALISHANEAIRAAILRAIP